MTAVLSVFIEPLNMIKLIKDEENHLLIEITVSEANLENADAFKSQVIQLLDAHNKSVVIDLNQVEYIDSSFLGALVAILKHAIAMKKEVILVALKKDVHDLLLLIRLDKVFKIYNSYKEALTHL
jgi:anti-sigma B factor antagonist